MQLDLGRVHGHKPSLYTMRHCKPVNRFYISSIANQNKQIMLFIMKIFIYKTVFFKILDMSFNTQLNLEVNGIILQIH